MAARARHWIRHAVLAGALCPLPPAAHVEYADPAIDAAAAAAQLALAWPGDCACALPGPPSGGESFEMIAAAPDFWPFTALDEAEDGAVLLAGQGAFHYIETDGTRRSRSTSTSSSMRPASPTIRAPGRPIRRD